ncbi:MAG: TonB-dependent receptor [Cytophagales bacterium]|nr:MAG: TonB-dependent receptor [Cytophagales bacterium]
MPQETNETFFKNAQTITIYSVGYQAEVYTPAQLATQQYTVLLTENSFDLNEVVISASKFDEKRADIVQQIETINQREIAFMNQQTAADLLQQTGNVFVQKSQAGGGSPVLRGFEANRVLIVVDGIRMNNAIYRGGHLQNVITLDNSIMDRVEVVFGPSSTIYGSDALGGVMHFQTKKPILDDFSQQAFVRYSTANQELSYHYDSNIGFKKWAFVISGTRNDFQDFRAGGVRNPAYGEFGKNTFYVERINNQDARIDNYEYTLQKNTAYSQVDGLFKVLFQPQKNISHILNLQYSTSSNISRYDRLSETTSAGVPRFAEWYYGPQNRLLAAYHLTLNNENALYSEARLTIAYQDIEESRFTRRFANINRQARIEKVQVWSVNIDFAKNIGERHELRYGAELLNNQVNSTAYNLSIASGIRTNLDTRYPDGGSTVRSLAAYFTYTFEISENWLFSSGLRYSYVALDAQFNDKTFFPFPFDNARQRNAALTGNVGLAWKNDTWKVSALFSSGFRTPNVDDLGKIFESVTGTATAPGILIVPNPLLRAEITYNGEISIAKTIDEGIRVEGVAYYTRFEQAIVSQPFTFNGQNSINYGGFPSNVFANQNAQEAHIYGGNISLWADITKEFSISSSFNYTFGRILNPLGDTPLDHIPPSFGKTSLFLTLKKFKGELFALYNGWKRIEDYNLNGEDNAQYATQYGMPAWWTLNLRTAYQINEKFQLQFAIENIFDQHYRVFASGVSALGRNFSTTLRVKL